MYYCRDAFLRKQFKTKTHRELRCLPAEEEQAYHVAEQVRRVPLAEGAGHLQHIAGNVNMQSWCTGPMIAHLPGANVSTAVRWSPSPISYQP